MAKGYLGATTYKGFLGNIKMKKGYIGATRVYSAGEVVTYISNGSVFHTQEYEEGQSVLSPSKTPSKSGYTFAGWSTSASGDVLSSLTMGQNPITLYAIFVQAAAWNFTYTGGAQSWTVPVTGLYLIDCRGAGGGCGKHMSGSTQPGVAGGAGGNSQYYALLQKGKVLYIQCGGGGRKSGNSGSAAATYNGGGESGNSGNPGAPGSGGGATHVAYANGQLSTVSKANLLCVAGGGGGGAASGDFVAAGGTGGGSTGGKGGTGYGTANGGTQTGPGGGDGINGSYGQANSPKGINAYAGGGGGGLYGGTSGAQSSGGAGGSGYIPSATTVHKGKTYANKTTNGGGGAGGYCNSYPWYDSDYREVNGVNGSASIRFIAA